MKTLNEAFVISKRTDQKGNYIAYVDPNKPENKETFKYKDIFKNHGAKWNNDYKFWFWYIGKTKDQWQNVYSQEYTNTSSDILKINYTGKWILNIFAK